MNSKFIIGSTLSVLILPLAKSLLFTVYCTYAHTFMLPSWNDFYDPDHEAVGLKSVCRKQKNRMHVKEWFWLSFQPAYTVIGSGFWGSA